mmetsp:Transcript_26734/g.33423  ORF Transcript_26734/g.33423 Transcript_26734/m.33423 type:complete len:799 (-) Transcript_26734:407-2803(-)
MAENKVPEPPNMANSKVSQPYFVDQRKGEVNELRQLLRNINVERDPKRKRDIIKKVIAYMTLGIDVSRLFTEMIMAIETRDLVVKKMVYLYLCNYAHTKPDMAIMAINTLLRDCSNEDPMVRGLALRSLSSLRLKEVVEYVQEPIRRSLGDVNGYVRKTAVMSVLKLHHLDPISVANSNMIDTLYNMIRDPDAQVVSNCLVVLNEIMAGEGGIATNRAILLHLLARLQEFNEWGLSQILSLVATYAPQDEEEMFTIMNLLDPVLRTSNAGVVLAVIQCFINLTKDAPDLQPQVYERVKAPILTLMAGSIPELEWCLLKHVEVLLDRCPGVFDEDYRLFYTRYDEPTNVKYTKITLLARLANEDNMGEIAAELGEYVADVDALMARKALCSIGQIAVNLPDGAASIIEKLIEFLELDIDYVRSQTVLVMKDLLRKYPERRVDILPHLQRCLKRIDDPEGKAAVIWMVGEFGEELTEGPYMIEPLIDKYEEEHSVEVRLALLTTSMKLFFKRAPEMQLMLGRLLSCAINDTSSQDLHDRALLYYRLLQANPEAAKSVVVAGGPPIGSFAEEIDTGFKDKLFEEFNSLSILYQKTEDLFVSDEFKVKRLAQRARTLQDGNAPTENDVLADGEVGEHNKGNPLPPSAPVEPPQPTSTLEASMDLLGFDDPEPAPAPPTARPEIQLQPSPSVTGEQFQSMWGQLPDGCSVDIPMKEVPNQTDFEALLQQDYIYTMASGDLPDMMKFFFYGQDTTSQTFLVQCMIQKQNKMLNLVVKTTHPNPSHTTASELFVEKIKSVCSAYC